MSASKLPLFETAAHHLVQVFPSLKLLKMSVQ